MMQKPYVLSIAGFDPCSGAGITADIKTFELCGVYGLGVCTAITFQNESEFEGVEWVAADTIIRQIEILVRKYSISYAKIGIIENLEVLTQVVYYLTEKKIKVIWDPILNASAGFTLHSTWNGDVLKSVLGNIYLCTPNIPEFSVISNLIGYRHGFDFLKETHLYALLIKGGHKQESCIDMLYLGNNSFPICGTRIEGMDKHGTGCVLSSAIVSRLALDVSIQMACKEAKQYVERFILSNCSLLGYHL